VRYNRLMVILWCLPLLSEDQAQALYRKLMDALIKSDLGIKDEKKITILFPVDQMKKGLGKDIVIKIDELTPHRSRGPSARVGAPACWDSSSRTSSRMPWLPLPSQPMAKT